MDCQCEANFQQDKLRGLRAGQQVCQRQSDPAELLETAIDWHSQSGGVADKIEKYMGKHQHDKNATPLWQYFQKVIAWAKATFPEYRREMKGVEWGVLYNQFKDKEVDTDKLEEQSPS